MLHTRVMTRSAMEIPAAVTETEKVQILPPHSDCQPSTWPTLITGIGGILASLVAWFREDLLGFPPSRAKRIDQLEADMAVLKQAHAEERISKQIAAEVERQSRQKRISPRSADSPL